MRHKVPTFKTLVKKGGQTSLSIVIQLATTETTSIARHQTPSNKICLNLMMLWVEILNHKQTWKQREVAFSSSTMSEHSDGNKESPNMIAPMIHKIKLLNSLYVRWYIGLVYKKKIGLVYKRFSILGAEDIILEQISHG